MHEHQAFTMPLFGTRGYAFPLVLPRVEQAPPIPTRRGFSLAQPVRRQSLARRSGVAACRRSKLQAHALHEERFAAARSTGALVAREAPAVVDKSGRLRMVS